MLIESRRGGVWRGLTDSYVPVEVAAPAGGPDLTNRLLALRLGAAQCGAGGGAAGAVAGRLLG